MKSLHSLHLGVEERDFVQVFITSLLCIKVLEIILGSHLLSSNAFGTSHSQDTELILCARKLENSMSKLLAKHLKVL